MHGLIPRLTPLVLDNFGLAEALTELIGRMQQSHPGLVVQSRLDLPETPLAGEITLALYRAAQEGITNALRHGGADRLELALRRNQDHVMLTLSDNGKGLAEADRPADGHYGLRWLAERVEGLGGTVKLEAAAERGARLVVEVPIA
jgi:two-component system sensor histidine kinase UhpB